MGTRVSELDIFPEEYRPDIAHALEILKEGGCREVHIFGSVAEGRPRLDSDIDLAVRGCPPRHFFKLLGRLLMQLDHPVDLVDLDREPRLASFLEKHGLVIHVE